MPAVMRRLGCGAASWLLLLGGSAAAQEPAAEGRAEPEEEVRATRPPRVYTNEDLGSTRGRISVVGKPAAPGASPRSRSADASARDAEEAKQEGERAWRRRARERRRVVTAAERRLAQRDDEVGQIESRLDIALGAAVPALMGQLQRAETARDRAASRLAEARSAMEQLRREARLAGIPPGWLRD